MHTAVRDYPAQARLARLPVLQALLAPTGAIESASATLYSTPLRL